MRTAFAYARALALAGAVVGRSAIAAIGRALEWLAVALVFGPLVVLALDDDDDDDGPRAPDA